MGKFERDIRKKLKNEVEDFDKWYEKNKSQLIRFEKELSDEAQTSNNTVQLKKKKWWLIPVAFLLVAVSVFLCFLPMMRETTPSYFGDEAVYNTEMTEEDRDKVLNEFPFMAEILYPTFRKILKTDDNSLVFMIIRGEIETEQDYYFLTLQIEYNSYYNFLAKPTYQELENETIVNSYSVHYELIGLDPDGLNLYRILAERNGQKTYWEVHCFEESILQFIDLIFAT